MVKRHCFESRGSQRCGTRVRIPAPPPTHSHRFIHHRASSVGSEHPPTTRGAASSSLARGTSSPGWLAERPNAAGCKPVVPRDFPRSNRGPSTTRCGPDRAVRQRHSKPPRRVRLPRPAPYNEVMDEEEAKERVESYLALAVACLQRYFALVDAGNQQAMSALNKTLKALLGSELTYSMWVAERALPEEHQLQRFIHPLRPGDCGRRTDDHVVPLGVLIGKLALHRHHAVSVDALRAFLKSNLVTAFIPVEMNTVDLGGYWRDHMPAGVDWYSPPCGSDEKAIAVWSRYTRFTPRPGPGSAFTRLPAHAGRDCRNLNNLPQ